MQDHVVHFYHLHALDWVDVVSALKADAAKTAEIARSISDWPRSSPGYFSDVQNRLKRLVESGQLGIFANGYWGHPAFKLPPEINLLAVTHYLEALEWQKEIVKVHAIFGGKNPHPNYLVGGAPLSIDIDEANAVNMERLAFVGTLLGQAKEFVEKVYLPDLMAVASFYKDWGAVGEGLPNYLAYGDLPTAGYANPDKFKFPRGIILDKNLGQVHAVDPRDPGGIAEEVAHSWYSYSDGDGQAKHPWQGETALNYTGPKPPYDELNVEGKYSWLKTPRWRGKPMEVGPLARLLVAYASGRPDVIGVVNGALQKLGVPVTALFSTLGRTAARGLETLLVAGWAGEFFEDLLANIKNGDTRMFNGDKWDPDTWPAEAKGAGMSEAPRGALCHWIVIKDKKIANYQMVVPSTWNASPRDGKGQRSAYETALLGTPVHDPEKPLEILRTVHSFDPCIACAVHVYDEHGTNQARVFTF
jgi:hydrogenase large subunit